MSNVIVRMLGVVMVYIAGVMAGFQVGLERMIWPLTLVAFFLALSGGFLSQVRR